jgi:ankyrin repeat protein
MESRDKYGLTSLLRAAENGNGAVVKMLVKAGADIEAESISGMTLLRLAIHAGHKVTVQLLKPFNSK